MYVGGRWRDGLFFLLWFEFEWGCLVLLLFYWCVGIIIVVDVGFLLMLMELLFGSKG